MDASVEIRKIFQTWLEGDLSQEDALFAIGDVLQREEGQVSTAPSAAEPLRGWPSPGE